MTSESHQGPLGATFVQHFWGKQQDGRRGLNNVRQPWSPQLLKSKTKLNVTAISSQFNIQGLCLALRFTMGEIKTSSSLPESSSQSRFQECDDFVEPVPLLLCLLQEAHAGTVFPTKVHCPFCPASASPSCRTQIGDDTQGRQV
jgi:hypothetical protein